MSKAEHSMGLEIILINAGWGNPEKELQDAFGKVAQGTFDNVIPGTTIHTSCIPGLYTWDPAYSRRITKLRDTFNLPRYWEVGALQGQGLTPEESIEDLYTQVMQRTMYGGVALLQRQDNQAELPVAVGGIYKSIHRGDKQHSHDDPRLVNFISVDYHPFKGFVKGSLDGAHSHLWVGGPK